MYLKYAEGVRCVHVFNALHYELLDEVHVSPAARQKVDETNLT